MARSDHSDRDKAERIRRLRERLTRAKAYESLSDTIAVMQGILDLLADEL